MKRSLTPDELFPAERPDVVQRFVDLPSGVRLRVVESRGRASDGRSILMLHGWGACLYGFRHAFGALGERRVVAADLRGFGLSAKPTARGSYTLDAYVDDVRALIEQLGLEQPALMGHSMGGGLALRFALRHASSISRLVLINPTGLARISFLAGARLVPQAGAALFDGPHVPRWLVAYTLRHIAYGNAKVVGERDVDEYWAPTRLPGFVRAARATLSEFEWGALSAAEAAALSVPGLVILGTNDRLLHNDRVAAGRLANVSVCSLEGGHCVHEENPTAAYAAIRDFLER